MPMEIKTRKNLIFVLALVLVIGFTSFITLSYADSRLEKTQEFNKYYNNGVTAYNDAVFEKYNAEVNYESWSLYYDEGYYSDSIEYCVAARDLYASANSYSQDAIANFEEAYYIAEEEYKELIEYNIKALEQYIKINWAMYEACEYFESATNLYSKELWDSADAELEIGNEKIELHDSLIVEYNRYISKIEVLEAKI